MESLLEQTQRNLRSVIIKTIGTTGFQHDKIYIIKYNISRSGIGIVYRNSVKKHLNP